jgi:leucyl/phenylalanyl-tRNA--protein transferase
MNLLDFPGAFRLGRGVPFPEASAALPNGLVAVGGQMSVERLLEAYSKGIFPWTAAPVTWWSPDPRAIFPLDSLHTPRRLRSSIESTKFRLSFDSNFAQVIRGCASAPRRGDETWVTAEFIAAYTALHHAGHAHSAELWDGDALIAGLYGVAIGGFFAAETMFHNVPNASKILLVRVLRALGGAGFTLVDTQMLTPVTQRLGAIEIPRVEFLDRLQQATARQTRFPATG